MSTGFDILGNSLMMDDGVYPSRLDSEMTLTNVKKQSCIVMVYPTGADLGIEVSFIVPDNYASAPVLRLQGQIDGTPANTFGIGAQLLQRDISEAVDTAYEAEDVANNATWTGYADEDEYYLDITLTPSAAFVAGREVFLKIYRDDSVDSTTWNFLLTHLLFRYTEA